MSEPRTFKIQNPRMTGDDIVAWEEELVELFDSIGIHAPIVSDGVYGFIDRSYTQSLCYAMGIDVVDALAHGVTPNLRIKLRHRQLSALEEKRMDQRVDWRRRLRARYHRLADDGSRVSVFLQKLIADTWGYHPGVHDGIDLISLPDVPIYAPVRARVFDVRSKGWWRLGAPTDPALLAKGDGIVQLEVLEDVGPFKAGHHIGLGHAEKARVKIGQIVNAGDWVANTGFANAWHIHLMYNTGETDKGIGNIDPLAIVNYTLKHG